MRNYFLVVFTILFSLLNSQSSIPEGTAEKIFFDDFTDKSDKWPEISDKYDIYLKYDDGDYLISRKNKPSNYGIQPNHPAIKRNFIIKSVVKIAPSKDKSSAAGIFTMIQSEYKGGFIYEINPKGEYRIKEYLSNSYRYHSGTEKSDGWEKSKSVNPANIQNKLLIKAYGGKYEFHCNDQLIKSIENSTLKQGLFGLWIGPETMAKVDYYYVYSLTIENQPDQLPVELEQIINQQQLTIDSLKEVNLALKNNFDPNDKGALIAVQTLEKQIIKLRSENESLKLQVDGYNTDEESGAVEVMSKMGNELSQYKGALDSMQTVNQELLSRLDLLQEKYYNLKDSIDNSQIIKPTIKDSSIDIEESNELSKENIEEHNVDDVVILSETESIENSKMEGVVDDNSNKITPTQVKVLKAIKKVN